MAGCVADASGIGEITDLGRTSAKGFRLPARGQIVSDTDFFPVQQVGQHLTFMDIGHRGGQRENQRRLAVHSNVSLHVEVLPGALFRRVHLRFPFLVPVFDRTRRTDDGGLDNGALAHLQPVCFEAFINQMK